MDCQDCEVFKDHSGIIARLEGIEDDVKEIKEERKWSQRALIGGFVAFSLNLIGIGLLIIRTMPK